MTNLGQVDVVTAIAAAQLQYQAQKHGGSPQFAQTFISDEGFLPCIGCDASV